MDKEKTILKAGNTGNRVVYSFQQEFPPLYNEAAESEAEYSTELTVSCSGICVSIDGYAWEQKLGDGYSEEKVQKLRVQLLRQRDVNKVDKALRHLKLLEAISPGKQRQQLIGKVKRYLFDSPGIRFTPSNFNAWKRLVSGQGTVDDARFIVHEISEIIELERIQRETGFDFIGTDFETMNSRKKNQWKSEFHTYYMQAHSKALEHEYDFIAKQVFHLTNGVVSIPLQVAASVDPTRQGHEARLFMLVDGVPLEDHHHFTFWRQRTREMVKLNRTQLEKLRLHASPTLESIIQAVKLQKLK